MSQNYQNHVRFHAPFHFLTVPLIVIALGFAIYNTSSNGDYTNYLLIAAFVLIGIVALFARMYAIKAQDRAARADERLRYYILSKNMLPNELRMSQILALRFAGDEELVALVERTLAENLTPKEIKLAIKNWRGDYHRI